MPTLYSYYRSSSSYRVRIALNIKGIAYDTHSINLHPDVSEQKSQQFQDLNPQARVPFFQDDSIALAQSGAIIEYLEERYPQPALLPPELPGRAQVRAWVNLIACDIQPLNNLAVLQYLQNLQLPAAQREQWYAHWVMTGLAVLEQQCRATRYCWGDTVTMADVYLVPQLWNARRFHLDLSPFPRLLAVETACRALAPFAKAAPEQQADSPY